MISGVTRASECRGPSVLAWMPFILSALLALATVHLVRAADVAGFDPVLEANKTTSFEPASEWEVTFTPSKQTWRAYRNFPKPTIQDAQADAAPVHDSSMDTYAKHANAERIGKSELIGYEVQEMKKGYVAGERRTARFRKVAVPAQAASTIAELTYIAALKGEALKQLSGVQTDELAKLLTQAGLDLPRNPQLKRYLKSLQAIYERVKRAEEFARKMQSDSVANLEALLAQARRELEQGLEDTHAAAASIPPGIKATVDKTVGIRTRNDVDDALLATLPKGLLSDTDRAVFESRKEAFMERLKATDLRSSYSGRYTDKKDDLFLYELRPNGKVYSTLKLFNGPDHERTWTEVGKWELDGTGISSEVDVGIGDGRGEQHQLDLQRLK